MNHALKQSIIQTILEKPLQWEWTVQGLGMLRMYLPGPSNFRLHIWHSNLRTPNVSELHTHPWHFCSDVIVGRVNNWRYKELSESFPEERYWKQSIKCGIGGCAFGEKVLTYLVREPLEAWKAGQSYTQLADEIHSSDPWEGTITVVKRTVPEGKSSEEAYVFWKYDKEWVSAEPRPATEEEILFATQYSLERWFK